jgi:hypothetical protein
MTPIRSVGYERESEMMFKDAIPYTDLSLFYSEGLVADPRG